ncbi:MAG: hypothetical protein NZ929_00175 [Aigarchaeota archaeon]|nr:hypothetical protein [Aigarchaeota archaeon]MCX8193129.1 hypothetical protein [Nitrososphaeria archaeon]MDW7986752.1 hypothetical protein [Nitrososphaerota archaeon]
MGGAKKPRISQLEKKVVKTKEEGEKQTREKFVSDIAMPSIDELVEFARTQKYLTPYVIAEKFGVKLSIAKQALNKLVEMKSVKLVSGNSKLKIFTPLEVVAVAEKAKEEVVEKPTTKKKKSK